MPVILPVKEKRIDSDYYVEGYATTFNEPYVLWEYEGRKYKEVIDRNALAGADMSDVLFQYNHMGKVFARTKMKQGKKPTLILEAQEKGLFIACDLSLTEEARKLWEEINSGLRCHGDSPLKRIATTVTPEQEPSKKSRRSTTLVRWIYRLTRQPIYRLEAGSTE